MTSPRPAPSIPLDVVHQLRGFSRQLVRELGYLRSPFGGSELAPSAVHAIIEIGAQPGLQARDLAALLRLDKSNTSRQLAKLEAMGLVRRESAADDARSSRLFLTDEGRDLQVRIDHFGTAQVTRVLQQLEPHEHDALNRLLSLYASALSRDNAHVDRPAQIERQLSSGYTPGMLGDVSAMLARHFAAQGMDAKACECHTAMELSAFLQSPLDEGNGMWLYREDTRVLGCIVLEGNPLTRVGRLRWFIVDSSLRGLGIGKRLLVKALAQADLHFDEIHLADLGEPSATAALYGSQGFAQVSARPVTRWGVETTERRFLRLRNARAGLQNKA